MPHISAIIITHNEEQNIERCLNSLIGLVDEIVVVDSYSDDRTVEICERYGCRVSQRPFNGFGSQRQYATGLATHSYVLSIDADEMVSEDLCRAIRELKSAPKFVHRMYSAKVVNYFCGQAMKGSGWAPRYEVRLFDKRYACWDLRDVHERLSYSDSICPNPLAGCIHHYRSNSRTEYINKEEQQSRLCGRVLAAQKNKISALSPWLKAMGQYLHCHLVQMALRDGKAGNIIANGRFKYTRRSLDLARTLIKERR